MLSGRKEWEKERKSKIKTEREDERKREGMIKDKGERKTMTVRVATRK